MSVLSESLNGRPAFAHTLERYSLVCRFPKLSFLLVISLNVMLKSAPTVILLLHLYVVETVSPVTVLWMILLTVWKAVSPSSPKKVSLQ